MTRNALNHDPLPHAAWAIFGVFFFESSVIGQWIPRIPDIKQGLELSDGQLGLALLSLPVGTLFGFMFAGRVISKLGLRNACRIFLPVWALLFIGPALAQSLTQLMAALAISGLAIGMIETAMNTEAARIEKAAERRLMSRCHGFWSIGTMLGALLGGLIAHQGVDVQTHYLLVMPLIAIGGYFVATALPVLSDDANESDEAQAIPDNTANAQNDIAGYAEKIQPAPALFTLPSKAILLLCVMPLGIMAVEGAFIDWSAVFMKDIMSASPLLIAITYSFFSIVMALVRLSGDAITDRFGEVAVVRLSGLAATLGIGLFALAPGIVWVFVAAAIAGAGVAIVFPLAVSAVADRAGRSSAENVAALNMISFTAFLIAPPIIGFVSDAIGLRYALFMLTPLAFLTFLLAGEVGNTERSSTAAK